VASSSIVGYIVGLGDRHLQNVLIDLKAASVIHIDLGIAFDQVLLRPSLSLLCVGLRVHVVSCRFCFCFLGFSTFSFHRLFSLK
jgi:ataxia telangiectasia mutated family protein